MANVVHGQLAGIGQRLYLYGHDISGDVGSIDDCSNPRGQQDTTSLLNPAMRRLLLLADGKLDWTGFYDPGNGGSPPFDGHGIHEILSLLPYTSVQATWILEGPPALGSAAWTITAKLPDPLTYNRQQSGAMTEKTTLVNAQGYSPAFGVMLTDGGQATIASAGSTVGYEDVAAATHYGLEVTLHHFSVTSAGGVTYSIQESSDSTNGTDGTWTTLLTFNTVPVTATVPFSERDTIKGDTPYPVGGVTIQKWLRVHAVGTFSNAVCAVMVRRGVATDGTFYPTGHTKYPS